MTVRTSLAVIKLTSIVFLSASIVFAVKYYDSENHNQKLKDTNLLDKNTYVNELKEILYRYDKEIIKNKNLIVSINSQIKEEVLIKNLNSKKTTNFNNKKTSNIIVENYIRKIDSLKKILEIQIEENKNISNQLSFLIAKNSSLQKQNDYNENIISVSKNLTATNVYANGIKIVSNNIIETKRFMATEQIKVCFTLLENRATLKGGKDIFIQIINPKNKVVCKNGEYLEIGDKSLYYSAKTNIYYDNDELDVCVFVDPNKTDIVKGDYEINIYSGTNIIGNTVFSLK
ncbi:hypothetical protein [Flavobacterium sp.]|uniref:hypothetical protein n=1 Tax=Flavobacterium sp. TaxID=239 RepID=UPI00286A2359|nr:hypothetical protein [Flavobacterium sp.]